MKKLPVLNIKGEKVNDVALNEAVWAKEPNDAVLFDAITLQRNSLRQGTSDTKTRAEVSGGGRKPWKQKRTGRARQGSIRATQWYHGGIAMGPHPRDFGNKKMNRKERRLALNSALAYKALNNELIVVDNLAFASAKTKEAKEVLNNLKVNDEATLIVVKELTDNIILATRNLVNVILLTVDELNVLDIVTADKMIVELDAVKQIEEVLV